MTLNDVARNREELDKAEGAILARNKDSLLRLVGPRTPGLLVWYHGAGGEHRNPRDIPVDKIREFVQKYA
jgi:hypothetical protein